MDRNVVEVDPGLDGVAAGVRAFMAELGEYEPRGHELAECVDRVVVIVGSSRGGTSLLYELLRSTGQFLTVGGEHAHIYKLAGLNVASMFEGDAVHQVSPAQVAVVRSLIFRELDVGLRTARRGDSRVLARMVARAAAQQPARLDALGQAFDRAVGSGEAPARFAQDLMEIIGLQHYDKARAEHDGERMDDRSVLLEEPPFVMPSCREAPSFERKRPLLLKASVDAYRLPALRRVFHDIPLVALHLTRNPYGAMNGLIDGWRSRHFHSHLLASSDDVVWWKFDMPPNSSLHQSVPERCRAQWMSAHRHAVEGCELADDVMRVSAEKVMFGDRAAALDAVLAFLELPRVGERAASSTPVVMATAPPRARRWQARADILGPLLATSEVSSMMTSLGYDPGRSESWL